MRLMFASHILALQSGTVGSAQELHRYSQVAKALGHEVLIYGPPDSDSPLAFSLDVEAVDALICVFEWTSSLREGERLDFLRLLNQVPRERRIVIDCDGAYNDPISVDGDYNHREASESETWSAVCDSLTDKICQPTLHPLRENVRKFLFYGYSPVADVTVDTSAKDYGMLYVGHSKFRWDSMERVLRAIEPVRDRVGRIVLVGHGWDALPPWAGPMQMEKAFYTDLDYMRKLGVEFVPPIRFEHVISWMGRAVFNPVLMRPTFKDLRMATPRMFETLAADTIPLFLLDAGHVEEIYGQAAAECLLPEERPEDKIEDMVCRPDHYSQVVEELRRHLAENHSHENRFQELLSIVED